MYFVRLLKISKRHRQIQYFEKFRKINDDLELFGINNVSDFYLGKNQAKYEQIFQIAIPRKSAEKMKMLREKIALSLQSKLRLGIDESNKLIYGYMYSTQLNWTQISSIFFKQGHLSKFDTLG